MVLIRIVLEQGVSPGSISVVQLFFNNFKAITSVCTLLDCIFGGCLTWSENCCR